ncbi:hypothetical protein KY385_02370 [Candidatus Parcubacteria bacterium]|nr:hypothetical protein [Candidatus Parcubacteria bacterium]
MADKTKNGIKLRMEKQERMMTRLGFEHRRNDALVDIWSLSHIVWAMLLAWVMSPLIALTIMVLWEPLEVLVLSPLLARYGFVFGFESVRNSLSDILFDVIGVFLGAFVLAKYVEPPFFLF